MTRLAPILLALASLPGLAFAHATPADDAVAVAADNHHVLLENEQVRVLETRIAPGATTPVHAHPWDSVIYLVAWSDFVRRGADGTVMVDSRTLASPPRAGAALWSAPIPSHTIENVGPAELVAIAVELKSSATAGDEAAAVDAVRAMYAALAKDDAAAFAAATTPDFDSFDLGKRFSGDELLAAIRAAHAAGRTLEWAVTEPQVRFDGSTAWITYVNRGAMTDAVGRHDRTWLESVVLAKVDGAWRVRFLHSTLVPPAD